MIINALRKTNSSIVKQNLLKVATSVEKKVFQYAYDPFRMYYVNFTNIDMNSLSKYDDYMFNILDRLTSRELTGNEAYDVVKNYSKYNGDLIKLICNKDLQCGVSSTTLNKVFGNKFIPVFKVQLAKDIPIEQVPLPILAQIKYNGVRVIALIQNGKVELKTRKGLSFSYPLLERELLWLNVDNVMLDGELCIGDSKNTNHTSVSGLVNSAIKGNPIRNANLVYHIFDGMKANQFMHSTCDKTYVERLGFIHSIGIPTSDTLRRAHSVLISSNDGINRYFQEVLEKGYEGLVLKTEDHKYTFKRSKDWIKVKETKKSNDADLICIDIKYGTGKYTGQIGSLICKGTIEGKNVQVDIGSGLTDKDRAKDIQYYIGKYIEVKYNTLIQNKQTSQWSLFLPRFVQVREDK